ncbi:serine hydrolase [Fulvitalea axinellae]|uniref:Serine hydrolase n=1 Tax=Fulvitalea axinellae TaxID=1182444 RepID=A0AAU9CNQ8_9BACT|nr:serine hydrolase [Fulvitalea axinellae]
MPAYIIWIPFTLLFFIIIGSYFRSMLRIISGFSAKLTNGALFISQRPIANIRGQELSFFPVNLVKIQTDGQNKSVSGSFFKVSRSVQFTPETGGKFISSPVAHSLPPLPSPHKNKETKAEDFAVLAFKQGELIFEKYAIGIDSNTRLPGWSVTKSVMNALVGIASKRFGFDIHKPVRPSEWLKDERKNITWAHLLEMSDGLKWREKYDRVSEVSRMLYLKNDMASYALRQKSSRKAGSYWNYSSGSSNILSYLLKRFFANENEYLRFPYEHFSSQLEMDSFFFETDNSGTFVGSSYAWATPRDWAKFGLMYANGGVYNDKRILDSSWVDYTRKPTPACATGEYGAHFWLNASVNGKQSLPGVPEDLLYCKGFQGQRIYIINSMDLVLLRFGISRKNNFSDSEFLSKYLNKLKHS